MIPSLIVVGDEIAVSVRWNATTMSSPVVLDIFQEEEYLLYAEQLEGVNIIQDNSLASKIINTSDVGLGIPPALHGEIASLLITSRRDT
jgi:type III secretory pathway component EscU